MLVRAINVENNMKLKQQHIFLWVVSTVLLTSCGASKRLAPVNTKAPAKEEVDSGSKNSGDAITLNKFRCTHLDCRGVRAQIKVEQKKKLEELSGKGFVAEPGQDVEWKIIVETAEKVAVKRDLRVKIDLRNFEQMKYVYEDENKQNIATIRWKASKSAGRKGHVVAITRDVDRCKALSPGTKGAKCEDMSEASDFDESTMIPYYVAENIYSNIDKNKKKSTTIWQKALSCLAQDLIADQFKSEVAEVLIGGTIQGVLSDGSQQNCTDIDKEVDSFLSL